MRGKGFPLIFWSIPSIQKMRGKGFPLIFWVYLLYSKNERKGFSSHFLNLSPLIWQKKTAKLEELEIATFSILGHLFVFLMYFQECHYCQSDLVVIEFTGRGPCTRRLLKSSAKASDFGKSSSARALASKFYYHQVLLTIIYHCYIQLLKTILER